MTLTPADRQRIREAFQTKIGTTSLPAHVTIDTLCANLVLAIPALLDALDSVDARQLHIIQKFEINTEDCEDAVVAIRRHIATLTAQLEADPCP